ncbi:hypothetical protein [Acetobacter sicerae]|uniref:hypothetical protein n=1 Tax=Acetobacter sicerae TaxID=85325 RepID=UPI001E47880E|nr:hypothetical protein [Acetobacter sicerae]
MIIRKCHVIIKGISPYSPSKVIPDKPKEHSHAEWDEMTWREKAHVNGDGKVFIPFMAFKKALSASARLTIRKVSGKGNKTFSSIVTAGILIDTPLVLNMTKDDLISEKFLVSSTGDPTGKGSRVIRTFPRVDVWGGKLTFHIFQEDVSKNVFEEYLTEAGMMIGVGRFRPENGGVNGRFQIEKTEWETL